MKKPNKIVGSALLVGIIILGLVIGYIYSKPKVFNQKDLKEVFIEEGAEEVSSFNVKDEKSNKNILVYINGEVKTPGVYTLKVGSRVEELIKKAGGLTDAADSGKLNLAKKLRDEEHVQVLKNIQGSDRSNAATPSPHPAENEKINLNTATKEELKKVPGIGDVTAQKIIDFREKNGGFTSIEDLKKIDRMGEKTISKLKDKLDIN